MKRNRFILPVGIALALIALAMLFVFQVRTTEVAVVTTFGRVSRTAGPGAHFRLPLIQGVHKFDQRIQVHKSAFEQVLTSDNISMLISVYIGWRIDNAEMVLKRFSDDPDQAITKAGESLEGMIRNAYSGVVGRHPFSHFVSADERQLKFAEIEQEIQSRLIADCHATTNGLAIAFLGIERLGLPENVTKAVFENMEAERARLASAIRDEATNEVRAIRSKANAESTKILAEAEAQALRTQGEAEQQASKFYEVFKQDQELAIFLLKLKGLDKFLQSRTTLILDEGTSPLELLKPYQPPPEKK
jgi:modulator of FtsH protease HflC